MNLQNDGLKQRNNYSQKDIQPQEDKESKEERGMLSCLHNNILFIHTVGFSLSTYQVAFKKVTHFMMTKWNKSMIMFLTDSKNR